VRNLLQEGLHQLQDRPAAQTVVAGEGFAVAEEKAEKRLLRATQAIFFFTLVTGPRRSLSLKLSDARVHEPQLRARLRTTQKAERRLLRATQVIYDSG